MQRNREVVVIGAGLTGLTCAWQLKKNGHDVEVLEKENRIGGLMQTQRIDGFVMEEGPSTGTIKHPEVAELFDDLAKFCTIESALKSSKCRLIWKGNKLYKIPSNPISGLTTPLFSLKDKFRLLGEPWRKKGENPNETVGELAERRLGKSFVDYAVDPFLSGVYASDPYLLPTRLALPKLYNLEQTYGGFIRGSIALSKRKKTPRERRATKEIFSPKGGFSQLIQSLGKAITEERISLNCKNISITPHEGKWKITWGENIVIAEKIVTTCPSYELPTLLTFLPREQTELLDNLYYSPVIGVGVGIKHTGNVNWRAFGGLVPSCEHQKILGMLMPSACFTNRAPEGGATFAYFLGGTRHPEYLKLNDEEIASIVNTTLHTMLKYPEGTKADIIKIFRHERAIPQYMEGTDERLAVIDAIEHQYPTLRIAGNIKDGIGMGDRIKQAVNVANDITQRFPSHKS